MEARRREQELQRKSSKEMNSAGMQREWMKQWFRARSLGNLNVAMSATGNRW